MTRPHKIARKKKSKGARGRPSEFPPEKLRFLQSKMLDFKACQQNGAVSIFYTRVTNAWLHKYGYDLPIKEAPNVEPEDPSEELLDHAPGLDEGTEEKQAAKRDAWKSLRNVSAAFLFTVIAYQQEVQRFQQWYLRKDKKAGGETARHEIQQLFAAILNDDETTMRKLSLLSFYQRDHYHTRIKPFFDTHWAAEMSTFQEACRLGNTDPEKPPQQVAVCTKVALERWNTESPEFCANVLKALEEENQCEDQDLKKLLEHPSSPEGYHL